MVNGIVKWFNSRKGYGFITPEGTPEGAENADIFVHHTNIKMDGFRVLYQGDKVTFDIEEGQKGKEARNIEVTERAPRPKRRRGPREDREPSDEGGLAKKSPAKKDEDEDDEDKPSHDDDDKDKPSHDDDDKDKPSHDDDDEDKPSHDDDDEDKPSHDEDKDDDDKDKDDDDN